MIRAIAAIDDHRGLAKNGGIPWNIPDDSQYFREQTEHGIILMGAATYEEFAVPLPNRRNIVASRQLRQVRLGFELVPDALAFLQNATEDIWVIGGAGLYASTLELCDELYLTHVVGDFNCDRFFPAYENHFALVQQSPLREQNGYQFKYAIYKKSR